MNNKIDKKQMIRNLPQVQEQNLERFIMNQILNPVKMKSTRTSYVSEKKIFGIETEIREGAVINSRGVLEEIREEVKHVQVLRDGNPISKNGFVKCQTCGHIVSSDSIRRCLCGQTCCISRGCGFYSKRKDQWFCSRKHASLGFIGINPRWF